MIEIILPNQIPGSKNVDVLDLKINMVVPFSGKADRTGRYRNFCKEAGQESGETYEKIMFFLVHGSIIC